MSVCNAFQIGRGTKVLFAAQTPQCAEPGQGTLTVTTPQPVSATPVSLTLGAAIGIVNFFVPAGDWLEVEDPLTGITVLVQLAASLKTGDTDIDVLKVEEAIADNSTITYPPILKRRTGASIEDNGTMVNSFAFEDGGYEVAANTTREVPISLPGDYSGASAAYRNFRNAAQTGRKGYLWIEDPLIDESYVSGEIFKGTIVIGNVPKIISSTEITKSDLTAKFIGGYEIDYASKVA
jgi:hypothetical protein